MALKTGELKYRNPESDQGVTIKLTEQHAPVIDDLLNDCLENSFSLEDLKSDLYFGLFAGGSLAAMGGVHVVSREFNVAAM